MANRVNVDLDLNVKGYQQGIKEAKDATAQYETEVRKVRDESINFKKELSSARKEVQRLAYGYSQLSDEAKNSRFGQEMAKQLQEAKDRAAQLVDMNADLNQELKNMASDTATFDSLAQGMNVFMQTTSAAMGVIAQFTGDEEDARKAVVMFTTAQSTLNAVTAIQNALQKQSALMLGLSNVQRAAATAATNLNTAAQGKNVIITKAASVAQKAFNAVAKANPYVLLATAIIAVVTAIATYISVSKKQEEEEKKKQEEIEKTNKKLEEQRNTFINASSTYYNTASRISALRTAYMQANDELSKTAILKEAAKEFKNLGMNVKNLNDAQRILLENGADVIEMIKLQGDIAAYSALRVEAFKESFRKNYENNGSALYARQLASSNEVVLEMDKAITNAEAKVEGLKKKLKIKDNAFTNDTKNAKALAGSLAALENEYNKYLNDVKNGIRKAPSAGFKTFAEEIEDFQKRIKAKKIELGIEKPNPEDIKGTEAWIKKQIKKLEEQKALLPVDAVLEREDIQKQIDGYNIVLDLGKGIEVKGNKKLEEALKGNIENSVTGLSGAISTLKSYIEDTDWSKMADELGEGAAMEKLQAAQDKLKEYTDSLTELNNALKTPAEVAKENFQKMQEDVDKTAEGFAKLGAVSSATGSLMKQMGADSASAALEVVTAVMDMTAKVLPEIFSIIMGKEAEAMAKGTASANDVGFPANIGAMATVMATVISTFAQIISIFNSAGSHAGGGIIPGSSYHGDRLLSWVDSGEMILNKRQQNSLFNMIDTGLYPKSGGQEIKVTGIVRGTDLILVQKNTAKILRKTGTTLTF